MNAVDLVAVVTTIQSPTDAMHRLVSRLVESNACLVAVGDKKGPKSYDLDGVRLLNLEEQLASPFDLARRLPTGHYSRKNVGYLEAMRLGARCIYEADDDNAPLAHWTPRELKTAAAELVAPGEWVNIYRFFTDRLVWPRGLPLSEIRNSRPGTRKVTDVVADFESPIQQGLANNAPDVDAVWRLVLDAPLDFDLSASIRLAPGAWCPFNSQSTWWWPSAYPLMYLPSYCSFRMTDIWRSFVAQRCLWELDMGVVFHGPEVIQERNPHDLMQDFEDEIPGYRRNAELVKVLESLALARGPSGIGANLKACYEALIDRGFFPETEMALVGAWLDDVNAVRAATSE